MPEKSRRNKLEPWSITIIAKMRLRIPIAKIWTGMKRAHAPLLILYTLGTVGVLFGVWVPCLPPRVVISRGLTYYSRTGRVEQSAFVKAISKDGSAGGIGHLLRRNGFESLVVDETGPLLYRYLLVFRVGSSISKR